MRLLGLVCLILLGTLPAPAEDIWIYYTSSMPEVIRTEGKPGLAEVATVVEDARTNNPNTLFIHGGASLGPSILGALDRGAHMIDILNLMEPDLMAVGKREFSYREEQFAVHAFSAGFPFISSNLVQADGSTPPEGVEPYMMVEAGGLILGFIALTSDNVVTQYGAQSIRVLDITATIVNKAASLRAQGADLVIALADTDYNDLSNHTANGTVDVILYAHNDDNPFSVDVQGQTLTKGAMDGHLVAVHIQSVDGDQPLIKAETIPLAAASKHADVQDLIDSYAARLDIMLSQKLGVTETGFDTMRANVRTRENPFGNLVADAIRSEMAADVAFVNSGGIRGNRQYLAGQTLTRKDIQQELPFNNTVRLYEVTGQQLRDALEHGATCYEEVDGCFLQVSNLEATLDLSRPKGMRVGNVLVAGEPLELAKLYRLGTLNFLASGGDGFKVLEGSRQLTPLGADKLLWEIVAQYLAKMNRVAPRIEGRLVLKNAGNE
jgi:2',3'-cyclic-nucleotide 2'-phosphodiesterase (5'-nucleotidase family)